VALDATALEVQPGQSAEVLGAAAASGGTLSPSHTTSSPTASPTSSPTASPTTAAPMTPGLEEEGMTPLSAGVAEPVASSAPTGPAGDGAGETYGDEKSCES
jgi:hypothetical protein